MKRTNPGRSTPTGPQLSTVDFETGEVAKRHRRRPGADQSSRRKTERGNATVLLPRAPIITSLYDDLVDAADVGPEPVYGQYPRALIGKLLPWLRCERRHILHVCSGSLPPGEGTRVDMRPEARPDIVADGRALPMAAGSWRGGILIDPPYSAHYARELYGVEYPRPSQLLREAARVIAPGGRIGLVHYITAKPVPGLRFVKAFGLSTGFDMPMRAVSIYERDHAELALGAG